MDESALTIVRNLIRAIGDDPDREGLRDTPRRVVKSWERLFGGYLTKPSDVLKTDFSSEGYDQLITLGPIEFWSTCEHHMLPFYGVVHIGYIPPESGRIVGISKLARLV